MVCSCSGASWTATSSTWMCGDNRWYELTGRYAELKPATRSALQVGGAGPTGLGTSAARIASLLARSGAP